MKSIDDTKIEDKKKNEVESIKESIKDNEDLTIKFYVPAYSHGPIIGKFDILIFSLKYIYIYFFY